MDQSEILISTLWGIHQSTYKFLGRKNFNFSHSSLSKYPVIKSETDIYRYIEIDAFLRN